MRGWRGRVRRASGNDQRGQAISRPMRARQRRPTAHLQPTAAVLRDARDPFGTGLPADVIALQQLTHGEVPSPVIGEKLLTLVHWGALRPWHRNLRLLATIVGVSPMYPVSSVTYVPGLYQPDSTRRVFSY
jgi:hypothetical protein